MPDLQKIDGLLSNIDKSIVDIRVTLNRLQIGKMEMDEPLTAAQKANLITAIKAKGAAIEATWAAIRQEWANP